MDTRPTRTFQPDSCSALELHHVHAGLVTYLDRPAVRLVEQGQAAAADPTIAILPDLDIADGVIEAQIAGVPRPDAPAEMRGFVGLAFRVQPQGARFECFFLRPTNGRANDQLRRNHSTQYISHPDHPWYRLREDAPGMYESYTDLVPGAWTPIKIVVRGVQAQLYVHDVPQPCLVVNDLKLGQTHGQLALWIGAGTEAYFSAVGVRKLPEAP